MTSMVLSHYDSNAVDARLRQAGVYTALNAKGFRLFEVVIDVPQEHGLPHTRLFASKQGTRFLLLDACITEATVGPEFFDERGYSLARPLDLVSLYWLREEDPTAKFTADRPPLPLQQHPGLGVLRRAFQVIVSMARELGKDGVACMPKFFHDAVIFFRSRLFLFLDGARQGRFEALVRDLSTIPLGTASLLLASDGVRDNQSRIVRWDFAPQVLPLSDILCTYFNSPCYAAAVAAASAGSCFASSSEATVPLV